MDSSPSLIARLYEYAWAGQSSDKILVRKFVEDEMIVDIEVDDLLLTDKGRRLLVRGSPALWGIAA